MKQISDSCTPMRATASAHRVRTTHPGKFGCVRRKNAATGLPKSSTQFPEACFRSGRVNLTVTRSPSPNAVNANTSRLFTPLSSFFCIRAGVDERTCRRDDAARDVDLRRGVPAGIALPISAADSLDCSPAQIENPPPPPPRT